MMEKNYFQLFGSEDQSVEEVTSLFNEKLDLSFENRTSLYKGDYNKYTGIYTDTISTEPNFAFDDWKEPTFKKYKTLVNISYLDGKNKDKESKSRYLRKVIVNHFIGLDYLRERIISEKGKLVEEVPNEVIEEVNANARKNFTK